MLCVLVWVSHGCRQVTKVMLGNRYPTNLTKCHGIYQLFVIPSNLQAETKQLHVNTMETMDGFVPNQKMLVQERKK